MNYDYSMLDGKITQIYQNRGRFAKAMGLSERTISLKMNGRVPWKQPEITKACELLGIPEYEINLYFFKLKVQKR